MSPLEKIKSLINDRSIGRFVSKSDRAYVIEFLLQSLFLSDDPATLSIIAMYFPEEYSVYVDAKVEAQAGKQKEERLAKKRFSDEELERSNIVSLRFTEALVDIAYNAGYIQFTTGDSRADVQLFKQWAHEFMTNWNYDDVDADYIEGIDDFFTQQAGKYLLTELKNDDDDSQL